MGQKYIEEPKTDSQEEDSDAVDVVGVSCGCYSCGKQMHLSFQNVRDLTLAQIKGTYYYVAACERCLSDVLYLKSKGINAVSFDLLWGVQGLLQEELLELSGKNGGYTEEERRVVLHHIYLGALQRILSKSRKKKKKV